MGRPIRPVHSGMIRVSRRYSIDGAERMAEALIKFDAPIGPVLHGMATQIDSNIRSTLAE